MREYAYLVPPQDAGKTVGALLGTRLGLSRSLISRLKFSGGILLDGAPAHTDVRVRAGQIVLAVLTDAGAPLAPYALPLKVPYRDADVLVVDKPAPLPSVHSARQAPETLENALYAYMGCPAGFVYRPVSRLDKGTSGLMAVALNAHAHDGMQRLLHTADCTRRYLAVTEGAPGENEGVIDLPLYKPDNTVRRVIDPRGKRAVTRYEVLARANGRALLLLTLETGRTHQIRAHLCALGCPVAGDYLYGSPLDALPGRFALHSAYLAFTHPVTGARVSLHSALPDGMLALLRG